MLQYTFPTQIKQEKINVHITHSNAPQPFQLRYGFSERVFDKQKNTHVMTATYSPTKKFTERFPMKVDSEYYNILEILCSLELVRTKTNTAVICNGQSGATHALTDYLGDENQPRILSDGMTDKFDIIVGVRVHNEVEQSLSKCILTDVIQSLKSLNENGTLILKITSAYTQASFDIINILTRSFAKVSMVKPTLSNACTHEKYLVCMDFNGCELITTRTGTGDYIKTVTLSPTDSADTLVSALCDANRIFSKALYKSLIHALYMAQHPQVQQKGPGPHDNAYDLFSKVIPAV